MTDSLGDNRRRGGGQARLEHGSLPGIVAYARFTNEAQEHRENDMLAFDRLTRETHQRQGTSVSKIGTTETMVKTVIDVV